MWRDKSQKIDETHRYHPPTCNDESLGLDIPMEADTLQWVVTTSHIWAKIKSKEPEAGVRVLKLEEQREEARGGGGI